MKAVIYEKYGPPEVLTLREIEKPVPTEKEILVKVICTTVTAGDWRMRKADPFLARLFNGLFKPKRAKILGFEVAGIVEEVGRSVISFRKGDEIFAGCGLRFGGYAEYTSLRDNNAIARKPSTISFDEAAAAPIGGLTALRLLRQSHVKPGDQVLIYGASGSVGTFAIQIAKHFGAVVTAVCSTRNLELVQSLGAAAAIDYTKEDVAKSGANFDVVFDAVGKLPKDIRKRILKREGKFISVAGVPKENADDMTMLKDLLESGDVKSVIDRTYNLEQIREAHTYVEQFHKRGNVVVRVTMPD
jgi:NADPH:quinone reductase-like Zn-dependent oxidoreductase